MKALPEDPTKKKLPQPGISAPPPTPYGDDGLSLDPRQRAGGPVASPPAPPAPGRSDIPTTGGGQRDTSVPTTGGGLLSGLPPIASTPQRDTSTPTTGGGFTPPPVSAPGLEAPPRGMFPQASDPFTPPLQVSPPAPPPPRGSFPTSSGLEAPPGVPTGNDGVGLDPRGRPGGPQTADPSQQPPVAAPASNLPAGATDMGNNMVRLASGAMVDRNHPLFLQAMQAGGGGGQAGQPGAAQPTIRSAFQEALLKRFGSDPSQVSVDSAEINPAIRANRLAEDRNMTRALLRAGEQGGNNDSAVQGLLQQRAGREAQFEGGQVADLARQRAGELTNALVLGGQFLTDQDRMALQKELGALDAQIRQAGINMQGQLGNRDLDLRDKLGSGNLNLGLLGLLQGGQQFGQNLASTLGMFNANQNQQALLSLLGGL